jgi:hypothetical protein
MNPTTTRSRLALVPGLSREGITWRTVGPDLVEIAVEIVNEADRPTEPGDLVIEAAAFGAFVPFRPMTRVAIGALDPGERRKIRTTVARALLPGQPVFQPAMIDALRGLPGMTPEVLDLLTQSQWAGNLNVYFDRRPDRAVEVHRALDLQVQVGRPVALMVFLPMDRDLYRVEVRTTDSAWTARVVAFSDWHHFLIVQPPSWAGARGGATIEATRLKDKRRVPVEFAFETVEGAGGTLGCIQV